MPSLAAYSCEAAWVNSLIFSSGMCDYHLDFPEWWAVQVLDSISGTLSQLNRERGQAMEMSMEQSKQLATESIEMRESRLRDRIRYPRSLTNYWHATKMMKHCGPVDNKDRSTSNSLSRKLLHSTRTSFFTKLQCCILLCLSWFVSSKVLHNVTTSVTPRGLFQANACTSGCRWVDWELRLTTHHTLHVTS